MTMCEGRRAGVGPGQLVVPVRVDIGRRRQDLGTPRPDEPGQRWRKLATDRHRHPRRRFLQDPDADGSIYLHRDGLVLRWRARPGRQRGKAIQCRRPSTSRKCLCYRHQRSGQLSGDLADRPADLGSAKIGLTPVHQQGRPAADPRQSVHRPPPASGPPQERHRQHRRSAHAQSNLDRPMSEVVHRDFRPDRRAARLRE